MLDGIHKQKIGSNDCGFYCMWYMEYYDASTAKVLWPYLVCVLCIVRATSRWHLYSLLKQISIQSYTVTIWIFCFYVIFHSMICRPLPSSYGLTCSSTSSSMRPMSKKSSHKKSSSSALLIDLRSSFLVRPFFGVL
jgi:hypothetical protein